MISNYLELLLDYIGFNSVFEILVLIALIIIILKGGKK
jgi:hypothetical protein